MVAAVRMRKEWQSVNVLKDSPAQHAVFRRLSLNPESAKKTAIVRMVAAVKMRMESQSANVPMDSLDPLVMNPQVCLSCTPVV